MEISSVLQSGQASMPSISRTCAVGQSIKNKYYQVDTSACVEKKTDSFYPSSGMHTRDKFTEELLCEARFPTAGSIDSVLKQAVSFTASIRESPHARARRGIPYLDFSASMPKNEQEAISRYAAAQAHGNTFADVENAYKEYIASPGSPTLGELLPTLPGSKPADIRTKTAQGTIITLFTPPIACEGPCSQNYSLQVTRKDGFQLTLPLDENVRMNEQEDGTISLYYPASGKRLSYDAEGNELEEMLAVGELGTEGDDILINVSGSRVESGSGNDTIFNLTDDVAITGTEGDKKVYMGGGLRKNVSVNFGDGNNSIFGSKLEASGIQLGHGNNSINMFGFEDTNITAGDGDNRLQSCFDGKFSMVLGNGNNTISTLNLHDNSIIRAGNGNNIAYARSVTSGSAIEFGNGHNKIVSSYLGENSNFSNGNGNNTIDITTIDNNSSVSGGNGNTSITTSGVFGSSVNLGNGNNIFSTHSFFSSNFSAGWGSNTFNCDTASSSQIFVGNDSKGQSSGALLGVSDTTPRDAGNNITIKKLIGTALHTGSGNDSVLIGSKSGSTISTGAGDDLLYFDNGEWNIAEGVDPESGHDTVFVKDKLTGQYADMTHLFK